MENIKVFRNTLNHGDKLRVRQAAINHIDELLAKSEFTTNQLSQLGGVALGSIKSRGKTTDDASVILLGILDRVKTGGSSRNKKLNPESIKSFLDSLPAEEKEKMLQQLLGH